MKIAITGATGFVGSRLVQRLHEEGHTLVVLSRNGDRARRVFPQSAFPRVTVVPYTPLALGDWCGALAGCEAIVNLAGAPIAERWTTTHRQAIRDSRIAATEVLVAAIAQQDPKPRVLVSASAIGYYGPDDSATFTETSAPITEDFLGAVCQDWEAAAQGVEALGVRLVIPRIGIVLGLGGALGRMLTPFQLFAGGPVGSGRQWFSWIHLEDLVEVLITAIATPTMTGVYNATAPNPETMAATCAALGKALGRPSWLPVPDFVIQAILGDGAVVVLKGQRVVPQRLLEQGFTYRYPTIDQAMGAVVRAMGA